MGCLNSGGGFNHWFGNIHLSGPCNRSCYFCIGQHMMSLDSEDTTRSWPLPGMDEFVSECLRRGVSEVNLTGTNTDPSMYRHHRKLRAFLMHHVPGLVLGIRTNGVMMGDWIDCYDKGSFSITTTDPDAYRATMGQGRPPCLKSLRTAVAGKPWKINVVLCPESLPSLARTLEDIADAGFDCVNLREPYGQGHMGDPLSDLGEPVDSVHGMPTYEIHGMRVTYWDVHYCEMTLKIGDCTRSVSLDFDLCGQGDDLIETSAAIRKKARLLKRTVDGFVAQVISNCDAADAAAGKVK